MFLILAILAICVPDCAKNEQIPERIKLSDDRCAILDFLLVSKIEYRVVSLTKVDLTPELNSLIVEFTSSFLFD